MKETVYTDFSKFIKQTDGKYDIINVPATDGEELSTELEQLGIRHMVMPDLNESDGLVLVAVYQPDKDKFAAWNTRHIISFMQGGNKELRGLQNVTQNRTSIITLPFEGELPQIEEDFKNLQINYSLNPDYISISIDRETLIEKSSYPDLEQFQERGIFA